MNACSRAWSTTAHIRYASTVANRRWMRSEERNKSWIFAMLATFHCSSTRSNSQRMLFQMSPMFGLRRRRRLYRHLWMSHSNLRPPFGRLYPEGMCTNGKVLVQFKKGAFTSGKVVQPIVMKYNSTYLNVSEPRVLAHALSHGIPLESGNGFSSPSFERGENSMVWRN